MIYPSNIANIWPHAIPLLEPAIALSGTHNLEDVRKSLLCGNAQLWIQWNDKLEAAVVTEFINYPRGAWFRFWLAGALKDAQILWDKFFDILYNFAKENNCKGIEDCGRNGWSHYAPEAKKISTLRRIEIKENTDGRR